MFSITHLYESLPLIC